MKKRKIKLFASVASLAMVAAVMGVGVWAATQQAVTIKSTVGFEATGIAGDVKFGAYGNAIDTITKTSANDVKLANAEAAPTVKIAEFVATAIQENPQIAVSIDLKDYDDDGFFSYDDETIVYKFAITNSSTTLNLCYKVDVTANAYWSVEVNKGHDEAATIAAGTAEADIVTVTYRYIEKVSAEPEAAYKEVTTIAQDAQTLPQIVINMANTADKLA